MQTIFTYPLHNAQLFYWRWGWPCPGLMSWPSRLWPGRSGCGPCWACPGLRVGAEQARWPLCWPCSGWSRPHSCWFGPRLALWGL